MSDQISQDQAEESAQVQAAEVTIELPGKRLRESREASHLGREEVAHHLRLDPTLIKALEEDDYGKLPSPAYICGYLRSYARLLKLDEREIVNAYSQGKEISSALIPDNINIQQGKKANYAIFKWLGTLLLVAAIIGAGLWLLDQPNVLEQVGRDSTQTTTTTLPAANGPADQGEESAPASLVEAIRDAKQVGPEVATAESTQETDTGAASEQPVADTAPAAQQAAPDVTGGSATSNTSAVPTAALRLSFRDDSWTEVVDREGNRIVYRLVRKGADLTLEAEPPFTILLGNASAVDVYFRGELFDHTRFHRNDIAYFRIGN